jgi:hypothetical protein
MVAKTEAELDALSLEELRQLAIQEGQEQEAAEKAAAEKAAEADRIAAETLAADAASREKALTEAKETPEEIEEREAAEKTEQERDEHGRFKKSEKVDEPVTPTEEEDDGEPNEYIVRREIDLGDGTGVQVFEGRGETELDAIKDLNDRLVKAQENATRTIREFQRKHPKEPEPAKEPVISDDQEYVFKQQFEKKPTEAFKAMFKELTGMDVTEFKTWQAAQKAADEARAAQEKSLQIQRDWVAGHPEYITSPENGDQIRNWVVSHNYHEFTQENLEKAFDDLSERGLLKLKTDEASAPTKTETTTKGKETRIEPTVPEVVADVTPVRSPKKASSVSTTRSDAPVVKAELTEDELYDLPREEFEKLGKGIPRSAK